MNHFGSQFSYYGLQWTFYRTFYFPRKMRENDRDIVIFYTEILIRKVVLWYFSTSEKIHNSTFQVKISVYRTQFFQMRWKSNQDNDTYFSIEFGGKNNYLIISIIFLGTVICPDCNMFCDNCENSAEDTSTTDTPDDDLDELKENLDQVCSKDPGVNFFMEFAQALGLENSDLFS